MKVRIDRLLVEKVLARSRTQAQDLIEEGLVHVAGKLVSKPSEEFFSESEIQIYSGKSNRFVSRGGLKLEGALVRTGLSVQNFICLDVGISTGGFTDCLLQSGATRIVGVDVGHGQLSDQLVQDARVVLFEGLNARELNRNQLGESFPSSGFSLAVVDLSFISLSLVLPNLASLVSPKGYLLALVKPQFEVGPEYLNSHGIVESSSAIENVRDLMVTLAQKTGWSFLDYFDSAISGRDGNREFFLYAQRLDKAL